MFERIYSQYIKKEDRQKIDLIRDWHNWFAWYPVLLIDSENGKDQKWVFWKTIKRRSFELWHYALGGWGPKTDRTIHDYRLVD